MCMASLSTFLLFRIFDKPYHSWDNPLRGIFFILGVCLIHRWNIDWVSQLCITSIVRQAIVEPLKLEIVTVMTQISESNCVSKQLISKVSIRILNHSVLDLRYFSISRAQHNTYTNLWNSGLFVIIVKYPLISYKWPDMSGKPEVTDLKVALVIE